MTRQFSPRTANWLGHDFEIHGLNARWSDIPGVYIFAKIDYREVIWEAIYVGQTETLQTRLRDHEK